MEGNCSVCRLEPAEYFCVCSNLPCFCSACRGLHETKPGFHFALPIAGKAFVTPQNQSQCMARLLCLAHSQTKLRENVLLIDQCREEIDSLFAHIQEELNKAKVNLLHTLQELQTALQVETEKTINEINANAYSNRYQPTSPVAVLVWTHCCQQSSDPIPIFTYKVRADEEYLQNLLEISFQTTLSEFSHIHYESGRNGLKQEIANLQAKVTECKQREGNFIARCKLLEAEIFALKSGSPAISHPLGPVSYQNICKKCKIRWSSPSNSAICDRCSAKQQQMKEFVEEEKQLFQKKPPSKA